MSVRARVPVYFDYLIDAFHRGGAGRCVHLGYWDDPEAGGEDFAGAQQRLDSKLIELCDPADGQAVLDVGCGFGGTLGTLNRRFCGMRLAGVNIDDRQLEICRLLLPASGNLIEWHAADACSLPFPDASVDRVLCIEAMFHFGSRREFFPRGRAGAETGWGTGGVRHHDRSLGTQPGRPWFLHRGTAAGRLRAVAGFLG